MNDESIKERIIWAGLKNINVYIDQKKILSDININLRYGENILILGQTLSKTQPKELQSLASIAVLIFK